ncbi:MAG: YHS domain-containing (seleno)protein [Hyphomicrobiaceae bacterium]
MTDRRSFLAVVTLSTAAAAFMLSSSLTGSTPVAAQAAPVYLSRGLAVGGYDPVAYFTEKKPVKGNPALTLEHEGAKYLFSSEANREAFKKEPTKYAPQYGGYCAWAVSQGYTAHGDPLAWTVHNDRLFLNYNKSVKAGWEKDIPGNVVKGDANWPKVLQKK